MIEGIRLRGISSSGNTFNVSEEIYTLSPECGWAGYIGARVRLVSGVDGNPSPGYHPDEGWVTVTLVDPEEVACRSTTLEVVQKMGIASSFFIHIGVPRDALIPSRTAFDAILEDTFGDTTPCENAE